MPLSGGNHEPGSVTSDVQTSGSTVCNLSRISIILFSCFKVKLKICCLRSNVDIKVNNT